VLELRATAGLQSQDDMPYRRIPLGDFRIGRIAQERTSYLTNDVLNDPRISDKEWAKRENMVSFAGYPLVVEDRLVGAVAMFARLPLNAMEQHAMVTVAHEIALGIERYRSNESLREREEQIRLLLDSTAEAIFGIDPQFRCTFANSATLRLLG